MVKYADRKVINLHDLALAIGNRGCLGYQDVLGRPLLSALEHVFHRLGHDLRVDRHEGVKRGRLPLVPVGARQQLQDYHHQLIPRFHRLECELGVVIP